MTGMEGLLYGIGFGVAAMVGITALVSRVNRDVPGDLGEGSAGDDEIRRMKDYFRESTAERFKNVPNPWWGDLVKIADEHEEAAQPAHGLQFLTDAELVRRVLADHDPDSLEYELAQRLEDAHGVIQKWTDYRGAGE